MKDKVTVDGVVLTRAQIEAAMEELSRPNAVAVDARQTGEFKIALSTGEQIAVGSRVNGPWAGKGLYLDDAPKGYEWAIVSNRDSYGPTDRSATLVLRRIA